MLFVDFDDVSRIIHTRDDWYGFVVMVLLFEGFRYSDVAEPRLGL